MTVDEFLEIVMNFADWCMGNLTLAVGAELAPPVDVRLGLAAGDASIAPTRKNQDQAPLLILSKCITRSRSAVMNHSARTYP